MTQSTPQDNEARLVQACAMLIGRHVMQALPTEKRGLLAKEYVRKHARSRVTEALERVVVDLVDEICDEVPDSPRQGIPEGRISVMTNVDPCTRCQRVTRMAHHTYEVGALVRVECEVCCPVGGAV